MLLIINSKFNPLALLAGRYASIKSIYCASGELVFGAGELSFLTESIEKRFLDKKGGTIEDVYPLKQNMLKEIKEEYLEKIKMFNNNKKYLIDKAPLNFRWIGFIMLIFPNAKVIHCNRDSIDTCWSNYKNSFSSSLMDYTYDFDDLAKYYKIYDDLMNFWNKKLQLNIK